MEQPVYFLGSADKHDQVSVYRADGALGKEQVWRGSVSDAMRKLEELKRAAKDTAPAPQAPAGGGRSEGTEPTKSIPEPYGSLGYKRLQYFSDGKPAEGYSRFDFGDPVVVRETGAKGTVDGIFGMTPGGEPTHFVVQTDLGRIKVSTHAIDPAQENTRAPQAPAGGAQPKITHAGMEIEEIPGKGGEPTRWRVTVPETGERTSTSSGLDAAKRIAENERKMIERHGTRPEREKAAEAARAAEEQARADAKKARSAETAGKSLAEIKAMDHMNRTIRADGKDMKAHEFVDARLAAGDVPKVEMVDRVAPMSRRAFNSASGAEQRAHEAKVKAAGKKESYWLGGYGLSKTEYDYAVKKDTARTPQAPAGGGAGMEQTKSAPAGNAAEKPAQDQAGSTAAGPGGSRAGPVSASDARQGLEEKRQMVADMIATKKANREAVPDAWVKRMADLSAQLRGETAAEGATYSLEVAGHPMYDGPPVLRNLIPIKVKTAADAQKALDRALDLERKAAAEFYGAQQALKVAKTAAEEKAAQARVTKMNNQGWDADTLKTLRDETIAELSRLVDAAPAATNAAAQAPQTTPQSRAPDEAPKPAPKPAPSKAALPENVLAIESGGQAEGAKESWKRMSATEYRLSDPAGGGDFQIVKKGSNWLNPDTGEKWPTLDGAMRGVRRQIAQEAKTRADEAASRTEVGPEPVKTAPAAKPAPRTEAPAFDPNGWRKAEAAEEAARAARDPKPAGKAMTPAKVKAEFQRQIDAVARFDAGGPETITLKAGGSSARIQNTARRVAEYMKALDTVKGGKTPKPKSEKTDSRDVQLNLRARAKERAAGRAVVPGQEAGAKSWGGVLNKRAPLKSITDMIDDFDLQAAVDFAAAQGIDLEEALKGDRKRLDRVRGLKPTPPDLNEGM